MSKDKKAEKATPAPVETKKAEKAAEPTVKYVTSTDLAAKLGVKSTILRRYLRTLPRFQDSGYTRYKWEEGDPFLNDIEASFKKYQSSAEDKKEARDKERAEKAEAKKAEKAAEPKGEKKGKKAAEPEVEEDADEDAGDDSDEGEELE